MFVLAFLCRALLWRYRPCIGLIPRPGRPTKCRVLLNWYMSQGPILIADAAADDDGVIYMCVCVCVCVCV
jgi:hypothetical protein